MRRFILILLALTLVACSAGASSLGIDLSSVSKDLITEHRVFLTDDQEDFSEITVIFFGHDTHKLRQINVEILFDKSKGYSVGDLKAISPEAIIDNFDKMPFASWSVEETPYAISYLLSFSRLDNPENLKLALQYKLFEGTFPQGYANADEIADSLSGRELDILEYGGKGLHFDVK